MEAVGPAAARHDAAGVLVDDHHLALLDDVLDVLLVERVGAQELGDGVDVLGDLGVAGLGGEFLLLALLRGVVRVLVEVAELGGEVGQDERVGVVGPQRLAADLGEVGLVLALVDDVEEVLLEPVELVLVQVGVHLRLGLVEELAPLGRLHEAEQQLVLRVAHLHLQELAGGELLIVVGGAGFLEDFLSLGDDAVAEAGLVVDQAVHGRLDAREGLFALDGRRAGDDQGRAGLVHQDGVDFVHDAVPMVALDLVFLARGHAVVAQVVEAELARGAVGDVAAVHLAADVGRHLLLDAADGHAEEGVEVAHPLGVTAGEVVVDGDELGVPAVEGIQVERQRGNEGLALARGHFGDAALVDGHAADELDVKMHHVPRELVVANHDRAADQAAGGAFNRGEGFREDLVEGFAGFQAGAELICLGAKLFVGQRLVA